MAEKDEIDDRARVSSRIEAGRSPLSKKFTSFPSESACPDGEEVKIDAATYLSTLSRPRKRRGAFDNVTNDPAEYVCADGGCEGLISEDELLRCNAPGCELMYHLSCQGLLVKPTGGWFCDDECRGNAGFRVQGGRKRRRRE